MAAASRIRAMLMNPSLTMERACAAEMAELDREENHEGTWAALDALHRQLVLSAAADPLMKPFSRAKLDATAKTLGVKKLEASSVQFVLNSLATKNILSKSPRGVFVFDNPTFERWVRTLAPGSAEPR